MARVGAALIERRDCPKCRYPMSRWEKVRSIPERIWLAWTPEDWLLPWPFILLGALMMLGFASPWLSELIFGSNQRRGYGAALITAVGSALMTAVGWWQMQRRLRRRRELNTHLAPEDWVCPNCLHAEKAQPF